DVPLSQNIDSGTVQVSFELESDEGLELGGWTIDDFCVVARPDGICGNGVIDGAEQCDDGSGNGHAPDACRPSCRVASCGDGVTDSGEACDDGNLEETDSCTTLCEVPPHLDDGCGCRAGTGSKSGHV